MSRRIISFAAAALAAMLSTCSMVHTTFSRTIIGPPGPPLPRLKSGGRRRGPRPSYPVHPFTRRCR